MQVLTQLREKINNRPRKERPQKMHKPSFLARVVTQWCNRLLGAARDRSFHEEDQEFEANQTSRDYIWNIIGMGMWGVVFPTLTIIVTQLSGAEQAGMFSMAYVVAMLLLIVAHFGIRTYQVSDVSETYAFSEYQISRVITCFLAIMIGATYCAVRGYDQTMSTLCVSLVVYKAIDGLADVYEGRLQQVGKMYLGGVSVFVRALLSFVSFTITLLITRSLPTASVVMAVFAGASTLFLTIPLAYFETERSARPRFRAVLSLFKQSWPLFAALFMYSLIDNMPKFVMEGMLGYDNQLYYNVLYFPAMFILLTGQTVYKPMLVKMAKTWHDPEKRRRFDLIIVAALLGIAAFAFVVVLLMHWVGLTIFSFLYGIDFTQFREASTIMVISGGIIAGIDFLYQVITILRRQHDVIIAYLVAFILALFTPMLLIHYAGLNGAVTSYLITMTVLFILMLWIYFRIRFDKTLGSEAEGAEEEPAQSPIDARVAARRENRQARGGVSGAATATSDTASARHSAPHSASYETRRSTRPGANNGSSARHGGNVGNANSGSNGNTGAQSTARHETPRSTRYGIRRNTRNAAGNGTAQSAPRHGNRRQD